MGLHTTAMYLTCLIILTISYLRAWMSYSCFAISASILWTLPFLWSSGFRFILTIIPIIFPFTNNFRGLSWDFGTNPRFCVFLHRQMITEMMNITGATTDYCGTPLITCLHIVFTSNSVLICLSYRNFFLNSSNLPVTPFTRTNFHIR